MTETENIRDVLISGPNHHETLVNGLWNSFQTGNSVDIGLFDGVQILQAHQLVLEVFFPASKLLKLTAGAGQLNQLLEFVYRGRVSVPEQQLEPLLNVGRQLDFRMLVEAVESAMTPLPELLDQQQEVEIESTDVPDPFSAIPDGEYVPDTDPTPVKDQTAPDLDSNADIYSGSSSTIELPVQIKMETSVADEEPTLITGDTYRVIVEPEVAQPNVADLSSTNQLFHEDSYVKMQPSAIVFVSDQPEQVVGQHATPDYQHYVVHGTVPPNLESVDWNRTGSNVGNNGNSVSSTNTVSQPAVTERRVAIPCPRCHMSYMGEANLKRHMDTSHNNKRKRTEPVEPTTRVNRYRCIVCNKAFNTLQICLEHKKKVHGIDPI